MDTNTHNYIKMQNLTTKSHNEYLSLVHPSFTPLKPIINSFNKENDLTQTGSTDTKQTQKKNEHHKARTKMYDIPDVPTWRGLQQITEIISKMILNGKFIYYNG